VNNIQVEGGKEGGTGTTRLGKQLVDEVLGKKTSRLGLRAGVRANAFVFGDRVPVAFPILLELRCEFENDWGGGGEGGEGGRGEVCGTHLHPIWKKESGGGREGGREGGGGRSCRGSNGFVLCFLLYDDFFFFRGTDYRGREGGREDTSFRRVSFYTEACYIFIGI